MIETVKNLKVEVETKIKESELVVIAPHRGTDCDALASALAVALISKKFGRKFVIVVDEEKAKIEAAVASIISELPEDISIIRTEELNEIVKEKKALLMVVDNNKKELIPIINYQDYFDIIVIDHHDVGPTSLETENMYIDLACSSASEIMCKLLDELKIKYDSYYKGAELNFKIANYLLAGIYLDTSKFTKFAKNTSHKTMKVVADLMSKGADLKYVNELFMEDFESDKVVLDLVRYANWKVFNIATALNREDPMFIYNKESLAKAADFLMKYKTVDVAFALGLIDENSVYISGRSKGDVDIGEIMSQLGGGGNVSAGAARIDDCNDVQQIKLRLDEVIKPGYKLKSQPIEKLND